MRDVRTQEGARRGDRRLEEKGESVNGGERKFSLVCELPECCLFLTAGEMLADSCSYRSRVFNICFNRCW